MDQYDHRTLQLLEEIEKNHMPSQRDLARTLQVSLGLVNAFLKRLVNKGYLKITTIPKNRVKYIVTPHGMAEKTRLTLQFMQYSFGFYKQSRLRVRELLKRYEKEGVAKIVLYGANDLSEIVYISLKESTIKLVAVADDKHIGKNFLGYIVVDPQKLSHYEYDKIFLTITESSNIARQKLNQNGIQADKIAMIV